MLCRDMVETVKCRLVVILLQSALLVAVATVSEIFIYV